MPYTCLYSVHPYWWKKAGVAPVVTFRITKKKDVTFTSFVYLSFLGYIKFCKLVLNIFKVNMEYSVHSTHFKYLFEMQMSKNEEDTLVYTN